MILQLPQPYIVFPNGLFSYGLVCSIKWGDLSSISSGTTFQTWKYKNGSRLLWISALLHGLSTILLVILPVVVQVPGWSCEVIPIGNHIRSWSTFLEIKWIQYRVEGRLVLSYKINKKLRLLEPDKLVWIMLLQKSEVSICREESMVLVDTKLCSKSILLLIRFLVRYLSYM